MKRSPHVVYLAKSPVAGYGPPLAERLPEFADDVAVTPALITLRQLFQSARLDADNFGETSWNPLGELIAEGVKVVIKPNWVLHANGSDAGMDCLVTHESVLEAILHYLIKTRPSEVVVGDAPLQRCDFAQLCQRCDLHRLVERFSSRQTIVSLRDFRKVMLADGRLKTLHEATQRHDDEYVRFDLGAESVLEPISRDFQKFRVTMYDPALMRETHAPGRHQYLVAREVIDADVVINVPKLKTHMKAGVTGALKNMVGMNGHKDYLPHHRKGGAASDGDCYEGKSAVKRIVEDLLDAANGTKHPARKRWLSRGVGATRLLGTLLGHDNNYDGAWHGNDTVWRTCHDLQRILYYGKQNATLASAPQRLVLNITDAIIAGEGEGPLKPTPVDLGLMTLALNAAAAEWVHAHCMGLAPDRIPLIREAFAEQRRPLADFRPEQIDVNVDGALLSVAEIATLFGRPFLPAAGWRGQCERAGSPAVSEQPGCIARSSYRAAS